MNRTLDKGGFGKIKKVVYGGRPAIMKQLSIKINKNLASKLTSLTLSRITPTLYKRLPPKKRELIKKNILMLRKESKFLSKFKRQEGDNIAEIYGFDPKRNIIYMKLYEGNLNDRKIKELDIEDKLELANDIINGLDIIHSNGIVHSDLKCDNILYEYDEDEERYKAYITDFGLSNFEGKIIEGGTKIFAPKNEELLSVENDIYSLGKTFIELFYIKDNSEKEYKILSKLNYNNFPEYISTEDFGDYEGMVRKCLRKKKEERPKLPDFIDYFIS